MLMNIDVSDKQEQLEDVGEENDRENFETTTQEQSLDKDGEETDMKLTS